MEIVKRIARWVLREELEELKAKHQSDLETFSKESEYLNHENEELQRINEDLRKRLFGSRKVLLSQTMVECIVKMLPDPNRAGTSGLTSSDLKMRNHSCLFEFGEWNESRCSMRSRFNVEV